MKYKIFSLLLMIIFLVSDSVYAEDSPESDYNFSEDIYESCDDSDIVSFENIWTSGIFSNTLTYGIPSERSVKTINSNDDKCRISVSEISGGICVIYDYYKIGIKYPVEYIFEKDCLRACIKASAIEENGKALAVNISVLPLLGSAKSTDDGYFVIPDGCGALINFKDKKNSYSRKVYGDNITAVPEKKSPESKQIYLPCYGVVRNGNAFLAVASKGDSNVFINADTGDLNTCNFSFVIRDTDILSISESDITVFENGNIQCDDIEVRYYPVDNDNASYSDISEKYREYITETYKLSISDKNNSNPLYINIYGGVEKKVSVMGIPAERKVCLTGYSQVQEILENFNNNGVSDIVMSYYNCTDSRICSKIDRKAEFSDTLGSNKELHNFLDYVNSSSTEVYPVIDNMRFSGGFFGNMTVRISGAYSRIPEYNPAYGIKDESGHFLSLMSPDCFKKVYSDIAVNYNKFKSQGISFGELSHSLYGDYSKKKISRYDTMNLICRCFEMFDGKILADGANAYMFPYVNHIINVPVESSRFDIFDEDIPFYQMSIHGLISYSSEAVNSMPDPDDYIMKSVSYGSSLLFDFVYENTSVLQETNLDKLYYADYSGWSDIALSGYKLASEKLEKVSSCFIEDYYISGENSFTVYSDGTVIKLNLNGVISE